MAGTNSAPKGPTGVTGATGATNEVARERVEGRAVGPESKLWIAVEAPVGGSLKVLAKTSDRDYAMQAAANVAEGFVFAALAETVPPVVTEPAAKGTYPPHAQTVESAPIEAR